jgi:hypothetical protein
MAAKLKLEKRGNEIKKKIFSVLIQQMVSDKKIVMGITQRDLCKIKFGCGGHLGRRSEMPELGQQLQPNFRGMVLGWPPSKFVSGDPDFQPRWPPS